MASSAVDNDVLIKLAAYRLLKPGLAIFGDPTAVGVLGAARYVVPSAIARHAGIRDRSGAVEEWSAVADVVEALEPSASEVDLAAEIEEFATRTGQPLDTGESQLCAIVIERSYNHLATGDKRAIVAVENTLIDNPKLKVLRGKVVCLEQLILRLMTVLGAEQVRDGVCSEPGADRALTVCLSCASRGDGTRVDDAGLASYIGYLRKGAPTVLAAQPPG